MVGQKRIVKRMSWDKVPQPYWVIQEVVTPNGEYIELPEKYASEQAAIKAMEALK